MGAFKLGKMTFGSLFKKPETMLYPVESKPQPTGLKGHIGIDVEQCILCGMCDRSCSTDCITVDKNEGFWQIDRYACVQCGYCVTVCPKKCLHMMPDYAPAATTRNAERIAIPKQEKPKANAAKSADASKDDKKAPVRQEGKAAGKGKGKPQSPDSGKPAPDAIDEQLERLLGLMDNLKAEKVRDVLGE